MNLRHLLLLLAYFFIGTAGLIMGHKIGRQTGLTIAHRHLAETVSQQVEIQMRGYHRVQGIREQSAYDSGFNACQQQF